MKATMMSSAPELTRIDVTATARHAYFAVYHWGVWRAFSQPINPRTGKPWQARRSIKIGDGYTCDTLAEAQAAIESAKQ